MTKPWVGEASTEYRSVCVYSPAPGEQQCDKTATHHVRVEDEAYGEVALQSCEEHVATARAAGRFVQEHAYDDDTCASPRAPWIVEHNVCILDDSAAPSQQEGEDG